ncbi:hypothetical protein Leryth_004647 [Lithospermum erythrorhizon]|nr:hypothetical protein Leryth_004647 [Lithospermum erythrorhizon]
MQARKCPNLKGSYFPEKCSYLFGDILVSVNMFKVGCAWQGYTFSPMASCMMHILLLIPLIISPVTNSVSKAPTSWLSAALRNANLRRATCLSLVYIQHPVSACRSIVIARLYRAGDSQLVVLVREQWNPTFQEPSLSSPMHQRSSEVYEKTCYICIKYGEF